MSAGPARADARELKGKRHVLETAPGTRSTTRRPKHEVADALALGGTTIAARHDGRRLFLAREPGGEAAAEVQPGSQMTWVLGAGTDAVKVVVRFDRDAEETWSAWAAEGRAFKVEGVPLLLVDVDLDGRFTVGADAFAAHDATLVCPLTETIVLGSARVRIASISADGMKMSAEAAPIEGTPAQLAALERINLLRARNGLPPADLDPELSRLCTVHADYLRKNGWTGFTNPHDEPEGTPGATEEGREAAKASAISRAPPLDAVMGFWCTYYHRIGFMDPALSRVGINGGPADMSVIDPLRGTADADPWPWEDPILVPGDGTASFERTSESEMPVEPVPNFASRGTALMLLFHDREVKIEGFEGNLALRVKKRAVPVPTLVAAEDAHYPNVFGIVPEKPLEAESTYEATFRWTQNGTQETRRIVFRTQ